ncbi:MAG: glycoside hydrolase family 57 protein [Candidatus Kapaibacterium sp.]|nr:hypothetical protein [Bacteroidota bacterium]
MSLPLRVAFLWHQHQPYYRKDDEFVLPWVRLHGIKDYYDLPALHWEFPELRVTYNIVPSLLMQLHEYKEGITDSIQRLTEIPAEHLNEQEKRDIVTQFFMCNHETMLHPLARYQELYQRAITENSLQTFQTQDWLDLQVLYNLTWIGALSRMEPIIQYLFRKERNYTEQDKRILISRQRLLLNAIIPVMKELQHAGLAELSVTPLHHPIMPLLIDTDSALEATPDILLPQHRYTRLDDADYQLQRGQLIFEQNFDVAAKGVWCSEGSVSEPTLRLLAERGVQWTATDEQVLMNTKREDYKHTDKYFPHVVQTKYGKTISVFFRDHELSDAIGFVYQKWNAHDAVSDFINKLHSIRNTIIQEHGEDALQQAVVPVILDGENCWEYYQDNGIHFLRELYKRLTTDEHLTTITFNDAVTTIPTSYTYTLDGICAGSWIYGNFKIWIGDEEKNTAWDALFKARKLIESRRVTRKQWQESMEHIYIAEGSDWYWWYGNDHSADTRYMFDELFRYHLQCVYELYEEPVPSVLKKPIMKNPHTTNAMSAMHRVTE